MTALGAARWDAQLATAISPWIEHGALDGNAALHMNRVATCLTRFAPWTRTSNAKFRDRSAGVARWQQFAIAGGSELRQRRHYPLQPFANLSCKLLNVRLSNEIQHCVWIHELHVDLAHVILSNDHVARQEQSDRGLAPQGAMGQWWIACAEDSVGRHILIEFLLHCACDVDIGKYAETLALKRVNDAFNCVIERPVDDLAESIPGHGASLLTDGLH